MYDSNLVWTPFEIDETDLLVAAVDFDACPEGSLCVGTETVTSLQGTSSIVNGLHAGFLQSDLEFEANVWNGIPNGGEYYITGLFYVRPSRGVSCLFFPSWFTHSVLRYFLVALLQALIFATGTSRTFWVSTQMRSWSQILLQKVAFYCTTEPAGVYAQKATTVNVVLQTLRSMNVEMSTFTALLDLRNLEM